jgi:LuxR family maltose regulon positive regulatory protein
VRWLPLLQQGLEILPATDVYGQSVARVNIAASAFLLNGDVSEANKRLLRTAAMEHDPGDVMTHLYAIVSLAELQRRQGRLRQAVATYGEARAVAAGPGELQATVGGAAYYIGLGDLHREWNDLATAEDFLRSGLDLVQGSLTVDADVLTLGYISMTRLRQAWGDETRALQTLNTFLDIARQRNIAKHLIARGIAERARLALLQGDLQRAGHWADSSNLRPDDDLSYPRECEYLTLVRVRLAQGRHDPSGPALRDALHLLDRLLASAEAGMRTDSVIEILILRALALEVQGQHTGALAALERALTLAEPEGYVRRFVDEGAPMAALLRKACARGLKSDYAAQLLAHAGVPAQPEISPPPSAIPHLREALTERELEVLRLLAAGRSNQEIAEELIIAVGTVKRHINSIMGKLQSQSRLEAVARARDLHLV